MFVGSGLTSIDIYEKVEIPEYCFALCKDLKSVKIHNSLVGINEGAFSDCSKLTNVTMHQTVGYLADQVFYNCTALKTIKLPNNEFTLGGYCFYQCTNLEEVIFDVNTKISQINGSVFEATNLSRFVVDPNNTNYSNNCFYR